MAKTKQRRRSRADWLEAGLQALEKEGFHGVQVKRLARSLNVARSGFYWHFRDRRQLLDELLDFWRHEFTEIVTENAELLDLAPEERLLATTNMIVEHDLGRYDLSFRAWAETDPLVRGKVTEVYRGRMSWLRRIFRELGFSGDELEMRARLFVCYHAWERTMFPDRFGTRGKRLIKRRVELLARK